MGLHLHHRILLPEICQQICHMNESDSCSSDCSVCLKICLTNPLYPYNSPPPQVPPSAIYSDINDEDQGTNHKISIYLIITLAFLTLVFFVVCCRAIYTRFGSTRSVSPSQQTQQQHILDGDFLDEEQGLVVDNPIWYIRTIGLQQSIINAITVCKYKKGEGLIEGTECSVCLSEFQEGEDLRLLPKCHHAFHLPCIDTWLGSHTNCPMCRAPIVTNPTLVDSSVVDSSSLESAHMEISENGASSDSEVRNRTEEEGQSEVEVGNGMRVSEAEESIAELAIIHPRRSVSLDSSSVADINLALATVLSVDRNGNSSRVLGSVVGGPSGSKGVTGNDLPSTSKGSSSFRVTRYLPGVPSSMKRSQSYNGKYLVPWYSRSQKKTNASIGSF
ncbi:hypothetical protein RJT34_13446 [Clitoria ternatea]|uniref:RING-type E3 ubiquitin transferase n=1 Tax=Clitoria ternatea TaxID=43366 RepID=A0AAN9PLT8_CLITE